MLQHSVLPFEVLGVKSAALYEQTNISDFRNSRIIFFKR
jgi:hypothetical protein